jgi:hypothetical protein
MSNLSTPGRGLSVEEVADRWLAAVEALDGEAILELYAANATIWHNFDGKSQTPTENLRTLTWMQSTFGELRYEEVRRCILPDGFVQQHVMRGTGPRADLELPAMLRATVDQGRLTRLEEYLDPAAIQAATK